MENFEYVQDEKYLKELRIRKVKETTGAIGNHLIVLFFLAWVLVPLYIIIINTIHFFEKIAHCAFLRIEIVQCAIIKI